MEIPNLTGSRCRFLRACGRLRTDDAQIIEQIAELSNRKHIVASYGDESPKWTIVFFCGGSGEGCNKHVHIDLIAPGHFSKIPPVTNSLTETQAVLERFANQPIDVRANAIFIVPLVELPERGIIRGSRIEVEQDDLAIKQSGGKFTITRGPVEEIEWKTSREPNHVQVEMEVNATGVFDNEFLITLFRLLNSAFDVLILGREANGAR